jgi:hypothetical protein
MERKVQGFLRSMRRMILPVSEFELQTSAAASDSLLMFSQAPSVQASYSKSGRPGLRTLQAGKSVALVDPYKSSYYAVIYLNPCI